MVLLRFLVRGLSTAMHVFTFAPQTQTLERMTNAYVDKYMKNSSNSATPYIGTGTQVQTKVLSPDDIDAMVSRCVSVGMMRVAILQGCVCVCVHVVCACVRTSELARLGLIWCDMV